MRFVAKVLRYGHWVILPVLATVSVGAPYPSAYIAGLQPATRPASAPKIVRFEPPAGWKDRALRGVQRPYPQNLEFLDDQEAWYTPFNHAGMTGRYDIRHLHQAGRKSPGTAHSAKKEPERHARPIKFWLWTVNGV